MLRRFALLLLLLPFAHVSPAHAAETAAEKAADSYARQEVVAAPPLGNLTDYALPPDKLALSQAKYKTVTTMNYASTLWGLVSLLLLLSLGVVGWARDIALRFKSRWLQGYTFLLLWLVIGALVSLPFDLYGQHLQLQYGLSVQSWAGWFGDQGKGLALTWIFGGLVLMLLFWLIRKLPRAWWLVAWLCTIPLVFLSLFAVPYMGHLFNHYEPLAKSNPELVAQLQKVVAKGRMDIPPDRMYLMKASEKVTTLNADVEGFGSSKRVVVWDNTIQKAKPDEILMIFGHESGHYVLNHLETTIPFLLALLFVNLLIGYWFVQWAIQKYGARWRVTSQEDWGCVAVLSLAFTVLSLFTQPMFSGFSRMHEHAADIYGEEVIHGIVADPQASTKNAFNTLGRVGLAEPNPWAFDVFMSYDHPAIGYRAAFGKAYDPWAQGMEPKYFKK